MQTKKRRMNIGDAFVGMKSRGSQLRAVVSVILGMNIVVVMRGGKERSWREVMLVAYLLRQNMMSEDESWRTQGIFGYGSCKLAASRRSKE